uniref:Reverse transcriptase zinc-binding domain-containing protein n=1 Tax=Triticum urartu TaxID=4572 RepID=A0A8R7P3F3_TRIUA
MQHLLAGCSFSHQMWHKVLSKCRSTSVSPLPDTRFQTWWLSTCSAASPASCKGLSSLLLLAAWLLWKQRNNCVFGGIVPSMHRLLNLIR